MSPSPTLQKGSQGDAVRALQQALLAAGFDPHGTDGVFGPGTDAAVRAFQGNHGLSVDGVVGPATLAALNLNGSAAVAAPVRELSSQGADFIARFEGCRLNLYNDPVGHATIGIGHLVHRGPIDGSEPAEFKNGITRDRALEILRADAASAAQAVASSVKVPLSQTETDALISFVFNLGAGAFAGSTLLKKLNAGDRAAVPSELNKWTKAGGKDLPGLVTRRKAEGQLFANATY
jgi:GH24 family phage-related lysozyme (muramidase)